MQEMTIEEKSINTIRCLAMDAVQKADSGHPGTPMALAPAAYALWMEHLRYTPHNPQWFNRDRFVLSNGHASMLQYAVLHLTGYEVSLEDIKNFRQWGGITAGHPEYGLTPGVETTTGPLGQGLMNAVGMAMAEAHLAALFNRPDFPLVDHHTYVFCSDGDLMEGASHEAASLAGHLGLGKLICLYDDNHISIEGDTALTYTEDVAGRFEAYRWHVQDLGEKANDLEAISNAFEKAKEAADRPSLIILRTHIAYGAPNMQDTPEAHGSPLGEEEIEKTKAFYGWPEKEKFLVPDEVRDHMGQARERGKKWERSWRDMLEDYGKAHPGLLRRFHQYRQQELPRDWDREIPHYEPSDGPKATRAVSSDVINAVAPHVPWLVGGSADLEPSTKTLINSSGYFAKGQYGNRNFAWGVREHLMCAAGSGLCLHGGVRPFAATFFIFTDYARPAIRLACLMELPVIYVMTHDSIGLGEDGPTHQPVEHLASFRAMPHMCLIRPADANEAAYAWRAAIQRREGPTMLALTRQKLPIFDRRRVAGAEGLYKGAYVISPEQGSSPDLILLASGSEVQLALAAQRDLRTREIDARVVSMPSWELFRQQPPAYRNEVLPPDIKTRLAVEAGAPAGWNEWTGDEGSVIGIAKFGASAPFQDNFSHYGFTVENIVNRSREMLVETI
jgi:transketolase